MNTLISNEIDFVLGNFVIALDYNFFRLGIDDIMGGHPTEDIFPDNGYLLHFSGFHLP